MHFALILVKGAEEAQGIGLIGQWFLLETQSITLVPRWCHPRCHRGTMEVSQPRQRQLESVLCHQSVEKIRLGELCMMQKNIDRYILLLKNVTENLKNVIFYVKKNRKKVSIFMQPTSTFFKKNEHYYSTFFGKHCFKYLMFFFFTSTIG